MANNVIPAEAPARQTTNFGAIPILTNGMTFSSLGSYGLRQFSGFVREEFLPQLQGRQGATIYREMSDNSPVIGGMIFAIQSTMRKVSWRVTAAADTPEAKEAADFAEGLMDDMAVTWEDVIAEGLSMVTYGYAPMELCYKRRLGHDPGFMPLRPGKRLPRSKFDDGKVGWDKIAIRGQDTVLKWFFDDDGNWLGLTQQPWTGPILDVPAEKLLLFRPSQHKNNPEGRPLPLDTPVRTPRGWSTMGAIAVGDQVYDETGAVRSVTGKSEVFTDRPVYEIEFSTGVRIRADACHIWRVTDANDRTAGRARDFTTEQLFNQMTRADGDGLEEALHSPSEERHKYRKARNISCGMAPILHGDDVLLPVDPYVLGYWLGNGITGKSAFSVGKLDRDWVCAAFAEAGFPTISDGNTTVSVKGLTSPLKAAGVFERKHIPQRYLLASPAQRLALLQGLMDSDGYAPGTDSHDPASTFANTNMELVAGIEELVRSLGSQPRCRLLEKAGSLGGVINGHQIVSRLDCYEVRFMSDLAVHRLPRKRQAQVRKRTHRTSGHFIRSIQKVENADTVCIEVDSPSHLFLAGEGMVPTHNSVLRNAYRSYYMVKRLEEQEAILFERMGGIPVIKVPGNLIELAQAGDAQAMTTLEGFKRIAMNLRIDEQMGVVFPSDVFMDEKGGGSQPMYSLELISPGGGKGGGSAADSNAIITRHNNSMMMSTLADFLMLGHGPNGTEALADSKKGMFFQGVEGYLNSMAAVINNDGLGRIWDLNAMDPDSKPLIEPDLAQELDLDILGSFIERLANSGMAVFPNASLESALMDAAGLPDINDPSALSFINEAGKDDDFDDPTAIVGPYADAKSEELAPTPAPIIQAPGDKPPPAAGSPKDQLKKIVDASLARRVLRKQGGSIDTRRAPIRRSSIAK